MKTWTDKALNPTPPALKRMTRDFGSLKKGELVLIPSVRMVDDAIRTVPRGKGLSILALRQRLAKATGADVTCPVYMGYHLRTLAEATLEAKGNGVPLPKLAPVWRVLQEGAPTLRKLKPQDAAWLLAQRRREGLTPA